MLIGLNGFIQASSGQQVSVVCGQFKKIIVGLRLSAVNKKNPPLGGLSWITFIRRR